MFEQSHASLAVLSLLFFPPIFAFIYSMLCTSTPPDDTMHSFIVRLSRFSNAIVIERNILFIVLKLPNFLQFAGCVNCHFGVIFQFTYGFFSMPTYYNMHKSKEKLKTLANTIFVMHFRPHLCSSRAN